MLPLSSSSFSSMVFVWFSYLFFMLSIMVIPCGFALEAEAKSIYDVLSAHGLPKGLLPKGVTEYEMDKESGRFRVFLDRACNAMFENQLHYDMNVSGILSYGQIGALSGISAQDLFLWFPVKGIRVDIPSSGRIYFDVGVVFKQYSLSQFESPPDCVAVKSVLVLDSKSQHRKLGYQFVQAGSGREAA